jgi:hypothetical protein
MKRLVAFIVMSLLSSFAFAGTLSLQDCRDTVENSKKEVRFPSALDESTTFTDMKCGSELYMGKPTYEFFYKITKLSQNQLNPDFQTAAKGTIFRDTCTQSFNNVSEFANRKYIYTDSRDEPIAVVLISSDECKDTPTARIAIKASEEAYQIQENRMQEKDYRLLARRAAKTNEALEILKREWDEADRLKKIADEPEIKKQGEAFANEAKRIGLIAAVVIKEENRRQKEIEAALVKKDDATCKSYGAKKGTQAYIQCRVSLVAGRQEAADRQKTIDVLEKKIETLQSQIQSQAVAQSQAQERERRLSAEQYASEQEFKNKQIELQQAQLQTLQQEAQSAREARKWQNVQKSLDAMGTVTPAAPSPFRSYRIDGRTYRCTDIGGQVNCR